MFDISGESSRIVDLSRKLNSGRDDLTRAMGKDFRSILGSTSIKTEVEKWTDEKPEDYDFWFESHAIDDPSAMSAIGISRRSLFSITEKFFKFNPKDLDDKKIKDREISGTERRLLGRISNTLLKLVENLTDQPHEYWALAKVDECPTIDAVWTTVRVTEEDWDLSFSVGWPKRLFQASQEKLEANFSAEDIRSALLGMKISAKAQIAKIDSNFLDLQKIKAGDILEFHMSEEVPVFANGIKCLTGKIFESSDQLGLKINQNLGVKK